ncbi:RNA exonuclease 1 homolog [Clarias gariepinus]|uniref:RNA exonuclease 1 homolog n=1 Tax=Clarias gariepinus TaxID=13013 RepID=UPI00234E1554|nr:RNA exonuclease 1 homolog [Clarias gariepinus]
MLRSTGFFRGIDCPFYADGKSGCSRPYCHFRHSGSSRLRASAGGGYELRKAKEPPSEANDLGYDPFNPEVVRPGEHHNAEPPASPVTDSGASELELVNQAIQAVQSEMEKEKKKLSRIGEQGYDPENSSIKASYSRQAVSAAPSHSAYDPGSYQMSQKSEYNPTPRSSKYTLDSESNSSSSANSMEYVPTAVSRAAVKKTAASAPTTSSSSKSKYTLDNSKPLTDMEYDPLSNFSAKPGSKGAKDGTIEGDRRKRGQTQSTDEEYVPVAKKPRKPSVEAPQKYTIDSESEEESSGNEYRPTTMSRLQKRKSSMDSVDDEKRKSKETGARKHPPAHKLTVDDDDEEEESDNFEPLDFEQSDDEPPDKKYTKTSVQVKKGQSDKTVRKEITESVKKSSSHKEKKGSGGVEKTSRKPSQEGLKKEKSHAKVVEEKVKSKDFEKGGKDLKLKDGKSKKPDKKKGEQSHGEKERSVGEAKRPKSDKVHQSKESSKYKEQKNGRIESSGLREKDKKKNSSSSSTSNNKDKIKKSASSLEKKDAKAAKAKPRSLSHADLFGEESPEEEEDERIVRKSASAFKRGSLVNKRKASDATESSSEDDNEPGDEEEHADNVDYDVGDVGDVGDFSMLQEDEEYDSDPMEECLRIFNESKFVKTEDKGRQAKQPTKEKEEEQDAQSTLTTLFPGQKKRVSHFKAKGNTESSMNAPPKPQRRLTAQEMCYQRMQIAQQQAAQLTASAAKNASPVPRPLSSAAGAGEKRRLMHRPNPALVSAKKPVLAESQHASSGVLSPSRSVPDQSSVKAHTSASMLSKTVSTAAQRRVAHTPTLKSASMKRPVIPAEFGAKVPTNIRQRYLTVFIDECLKFCLSEEEAYQMALDEEKLVYDRSSSKSIYLNVAVNTLKKLRSKSATPSTPAASQSFKKSTTSASRKSQSHEGVLGGRLAATTSYTINRMGRQQDMQLRGAVLYQKLKPYVLSEEQLQEHGYPRPHPERLGHAFIYNAPEKKNQDPFAKVCCRCGAEYKVNASGSCVRKEECNHHWGRLRRYKVSGGWETQYNCCSGAVGSLGCQVAKQHVQDGRKESLDGFVKTFSKSSSPDGNAGVYALDCEMCYTKQGLELTRVTVINSDLKVIYDTFVKPESKVVDYNTRFSGVTEEDLENATMRLRDVQAVLLNMFSAETILIGHSLESDLFALKLLHSTVVDTAVVFPHRLGLPFKRALRNVMADHLKRIIQDNAEGHDSSEDAAACMELMIWKIKEDAKVKR